MTKILSTLLMVLGVPLVSSAQSQKNEKIIRAYFGGFAKKDWNQVAAQLDDNFTFTSPAPDDHINIAQFKAECWPQAEHMLPLLRLRLRGRHHSRVSRYHTSQ